MVHVAILGFGVVGSGVAEVLDKNARQIAQKAGREKIVKDFSIIENDPDVSIVVETIGGVGVAREFTTRALKAGKSVVTSNKELVAELGCELLKLAKDNHASYLFEASVGGGIPILRPLSQCLAANELTEICGILNGTTNYILTRMIHSGCSLEAALKEAQDNGYAEQNPSADLEGHDACRKICILASIAFGRHVMPVQVPTEGITNVTLADVAYADSCGRKIKLLGRAMQLDDGKVCAYVAPHLVGGSDPLAGVDDVFNGISVKGDAIGDVMFYGRGAGKLPTASAVAADVIDIARGAGSDKLMGWLPGGDDFAVPPDGLVSRWYVRMNASAARARAGLGSVELLGRAGAPEEETACLTEPMTEVELKTALSDLKILSAFRVLN